MKNKKESEYVSLRIVLSMRVISKEVEAALKSMKDLLNDRPELAPLILDIVDLVARIGNLDFLTNAQDDLPLRVAVLQQHVKDLQKAVEELGKSTTQQQDHHKDKNSVIAERFSKLWAGKGRGRRLMREGEDLMHELFAGGMSDGKISELSTMTLRMVKMRREKWKALRTTRAQSSVRKNHDHSQRTLTTPDSGVTSDDVGTTKERPERASRSGDKRQVPHTEAIQSQRNEGNMLDNVVTPSSSLYREKLKSSSQNATARRSESVDPREPRFGLDSFQRTEMANILIEWRFRRHKNGLTLTLIGKRFGITRDAVKKTYLPVLEKAGLLDKDKRITREEMLEAYASRNSLP